MSKDTAEAQGQENKEKKSVEKKATVSFGNHELWNDIVSPPPEWTEGNTQISKIQLIWPDPRVEIARYKAVNSIREAFERLCIEAGVSIPSGIIERWEFYFLQILAYIYIYLPRSKTVYILLP